MNFRPLGIVAVGGVLGLVGAGLWNISHAPVRPAETRRSTPSPSSMAEAPGAPRSFTPATPSAALAGPTPPVRPPRPSPEALRDMDNVQLMFRDFRTRMGGNPVGTNAEIMKNVMGGNPVQARLGPPEGQNLNEQGELVDRWGTPYFFHQLSSNEMEIRSAGPDQVMWTSDDVVAK